jgi:sarcosine oxidase gamma subunit
VLPPPYVSAADGDTVVIHAPREPLAPLLNQLEFKPTTPAGDVLSRAVADEAEKARVMAALREAGVSFARGREWSPAEVFERLRDQGLLTGAFRSISWLGPDRFHVREEA